MRWGSKTKSWYFFLQFLYSLKPRVRPTTCVGIKLLGWTGRISFLPLFRLNWCQVFGRGFLCCHHNYGDQERGFIDSGYIRKRDRPGVGTIRGREIQSNASITSILRYFVRLNVTGHAPTPAKGKVCTGSFYFVRGKRCKVYWGRKRPFMRWSRPSVCPAVHLSVRPSVCLSLFCSDDSWTQGYRDYRVKFEIKIKGQT